MYFYGQVGVAIYSKRKLWNSLWLKRIGSTLIVMVNVILLLLVDGLLTQQSLQKVDCYVQKIQLLM